MKKNGKKKAPKLPRFDAPKDMRSRTFMSKKDKAKRRGDLNGELRDELGR